MYKNSSYSKTMQKMKLAEVQSDLQTDAEEVEQKRKRKPNSRYGDISSSSESASDESPVKRKKQSPEKLKRPTSKKSVPILPSLPALPTPPNLPGPSRSPHITPKRPCLQEVPQSATSKQVSIVEKKYLTLLEEIKAQVSQNTKLLNILIKKEEQQGDIQDLPEGIHFPVNTRDEFDNMEERLQNDKTGKMLVNHLGTIGGDSCTDCTRRTIKYCVTNDLATQFNWTGLGEKKAFGTSKLLLVIRRAVRKNRLSANASDREIDNVIKDWLRFAKDREGGRKKRAEKKKQSQQEQQEEQEGQAENIEN